MNESERRKRFANYEGKCWTGLKSDFSRESSLAVMKDAAQDSLLSTVVHYL